MTNPTPDLPILDDEAIAEIRTKSAKYKQLANRAATPADADVIRWFAKNVSALCQTVRALRAELRQIREDRDELSDTIEACHKMFDQIEPDYEEGMTSLTPLESRVREHLFPSDIITDSMVNGDD